MILKITSEGQVSFPDDLLEALGVGPGDLLEITEGTEGFIIRPKRIDYSKLAPLKDKIPPDFPPFDIRKFRDATYDQSLRD